MLQPSKTLTNPYYFIRGNTIYNISTAQDYDGCGKQLVAPDSSLTVSLKRQQIDYTTGELTGEWENYDYTMSISSANHTTFPSLMVYYKYMASTTVRVDVEKTEQRQKVDPETGELVYDEDGNPVMEDYTYTVTKYVTREEERQSADYWWWQNLIKNGDRYDGTKFIINPNHDVDNDENGETSYMDVVFKSINRDIKGWAKEGYTAQQMYQKLPLWATIKVGDAYNNGEITFVEYNDSTGIKDYSANNYKAINDIIFDTIQEQSVEYMNGRLKNYNKQVKSSFDIETVITDK